MPVFSFSAGQVGDGQALASVSVDAADMGEQLAQVVNRLADGEPGSAIGLLVPRAQLVISPKTADHLKITFPQQVLQAARVQ
jgi:ABC-type uncharacterized transport system substrate-binding protein